MKRHIGWSSCRTVECLNLGKMARDFQEKHFRHGAKSARTYRNKRGQKAFHGTSVLRGTQILSGNKVNKFSPDKLPPNSSSCWNTFYHISGTSCYSLTFLKCFSCMILVLSCFGLGRILHDLDGR